MKSGTERELKLSIPERRHYLHLRDDRVWGERDPPVVQVNHYFDSAAGRLRRARILLRLREERPEGGEVARSLTLKLGREVQPGHYEAHEAELPVTAEDMRLGLADPGRLLAGHPGLLEPAARALAGEALRHVGSLENHRVVRRVAGLRLEVDRLVLPHQREAHELEVETEDLATAEAWLRAQAARHGIRLEPARRTKMELFMDALRR